MSKRRAFTLVEVLLAVAITSILIVLLTSVVSATLNAWQQGRNRLQTFSVARQQLSRITDEISGALAASGRIEFVENDSSLTTGGTSPVPETSESLFFVAPYPNSGAGDLCVIAYRHNATAYTLERAFVKSDSAWNDPQPANRFKVPGYAGNLQWQKVADGILEFEVRSFSQADIDQGASPQPAWNSTGASVMGGKTPRRITLRLKTVDDKSLVRLSALPPSSPGYSKILLQSARNFTADVSLPSR